MRIRELTYEERMVWGECPVCKAPDGQPCYAEVGLHLGVKGDGSRLKTGEGVHMARLRNAPEKVKTVPA
jgi:hypothetical protein